MYFNYSMICVIIAIITEKELNVLTVQEQNGGNDEI